MSENTHNCSIILPHLNQYDELIACLKAIINLDKSGLEVETLVIDNGSTNWNQNQWKASYPWAQFYTCHEAPNPYSCRNLGIQLSRGSVIILLDVNCRPYKDYLIRGMEALNEGADLVAGQYIFDYPNHQLSSKVHGILYLLNERNDRYKRGFPGGNLIVKKSLFTELGLFDTTLNTGNDIKWSLKIRQHGKKLVYNKAMKVAYTAKTLYQLKLSMKKYARGVVHQKDPLSTASSSLLSILPMWPHHFKAAYKERGLSENHISQLRLYLYVWQMKIYFGLCLLKARWIGR